MIQLNLLPDVKLEYIKAQKARRLVFSVSILVAGISIIILLMLLSADALQRKHLNDLTNDIHDETSQLQQKPNINRILTVQNQLSSLTKLHEDKPAASRLFVYLIQLTPSNVDITDLKVDFTKNTISVTGTSDSLTNVNKYVDTLKLTTFTTTNDKTKNQAFNDVVLSSFSLNTDTQDPNQAANFTITANYNPTIFDITQKVNLIVPNLVATRSESDLFKAAPQTNGGTQ